MRLLIVGGSGMLGHKLVQRLHDRFDVWTTVRGSAAAYRRYGFVRPERVVAAVDAANFDSVVDAFRQVRPDAVVNAVGIVKQLREAHDPLVSIAINALFPHRLAALAGASGCRLVHVSTDCVFSGRKGGYTEDDPSDAEDLYGRSKFLGEVGHEGSLTLRTSIIGRELAGASGLVEWFLGARDGTVPGYRNAIFSGLTTDAFASALAHILTRNPGLSGVYHLSSDPISKYDLLCLLRDAYARKTSITPQTEPRIDRTLDSRRLRQATGFAPPPWAEMVKNMVADPTPYDLWRSSNA